MVVRANIFIVSIFHPKPLWDRAKLSEAKALIQMSGMGIGSYDGIEL